MASYKDYKSVSAAQKAGSLYFMGKDGKKKLAVTKEELEKAFLIIDQAITEVS